MQDFSKGVGDLIQIVLGEKIQIQNIFGQAGHLAVPLKSLLICPCKVH